MAKGRVKQLLAAVSAAVLLSGDFAVQAASVDGQEQISRLQEEEETAPDMPEENGEAADGGTEERIEEARDALAQIAAEREIEALVYLNDEYPIRQEPSYDGNEMISVPSGQTVRIQDICIEDEGVVWAYVELEQKGRKISGYIPRIYLATSDMRFLEWEEQYGLGWQAFGINQAGGTIYQDVEQFPASYRPALLALKQKYPKWTFVKMNTGLDWKTVIANEHKGDTSLVYDTLPDWMKEGRHGTSRWYYASEAAVMMYMDPRNGLTENAIFQFEQLTYNEEYHTRDAISAFLKSTFMSDSQGQKAPGTDLSYAEIFWNLGREKGISPFHLSARVLQEQGREGRSALISGKYPGYEGYYNYFNVKASGNSDMEVIVNGLRHAKSQGWSNAYASIRGGSELLSTNYIKRGQDTLYLQKYNVNPNGYYPLYTHQYMQNISGPTSEALSIKKLYQEAGSLDSAFVFKIPVYNNMPAKPCGAPGSGGDDVDDGGNGGGGNGGNGGGSDGAGDEDNMFPGGDLIYLGGKYYYYENGVMAVSKEAYVEGAWRWFDADGAMAVDKDVYLSSSGGKWVRYDKRGEMVKGEDCKDGAWYRFDQVTGAMVKGWYTDERGAAYYYDTHNGRMVYGEQTIDGIPCYFDYETGIGADKVWISWGGNGGMYWYEGGRRQGLEGRGKEIYDPGSDGWYWLDSVDRGRKAAGKDVYQESASAYPDRPDGTGKWVRYDRNGRMVKGWDYTDRGTYYFEEVTGSMAKGHVVIDGKTYYFDENTGILKK